MKHYITLVLAALLSVTLNATAGGLTNVNCSADSRHNLGSNPFYYDLNYFIFFCDANQVDVAENATAQLYCEDKLYMECPIQIQDTESNDGNKKYSNAIISFSEPVSLPKNNKYRLHVEEGLIYNVENTDQSNDELNFEFEVPASVGPFRCSINYNSIKGGETVESLENISFTVPTEVESDHFELILTRKGVPVRTYDSYASWDWDLGTVFTEIKQPIRFEDGLVYSFIIPAGAVHNIFREDMVNDKTEFKFVGGCKETFRTLEYSGYARSEESDPGTFGVVNIYYDDEIVLCGAPYVCFYESKYQTGYDAITPDLKEENGRYILTIDLSSKPLKQDTNGYIELPEATVVTPSGDLIVNKRSYIPLRELIDGSGVAAIEDVTEENGNYYDLNGTILPDAPEKGFYIEKRGKTSKIRRR